MPAAVLLPLDGFDHEQALQADLDGLLLNTELPQRPVYIRLAQELFGVETTVSDYAFAQGASKEATISGLNERFGRLNLRDESVMAAHASVGELMVERLVQVRHTEMKTDGIELMPGAVELFNLADRARMKRGVATSRVEEVAQEMLHAVGFLPRLHSVVGKNTKGVTAAKPAPDIGRVSADQLRTEPKNCWACEDSPSGVQGQAAAGAKVLYVADLRVAGIDPAARRLATHTVTSLEDAVSFLERDLGL